MNNTIKNVIIFVAGAAVGAAASYKYFKTKYERIADEEIASVKEVFSRKNKTAENTEDESDSETSDEEDADDEGESFEKYTTLAASYGYPADLENLDKKGGSEFMAKDKPFVIKPHELGEDEDYDINTLRYYEDGVLTDYSGNVIEDVEACVGKDALTHFGENEGDEDSVYVQNDVYGCYYEIIKEPGTYDESLVNTYEDPEDDE